jgi:transcriptional regulator with XRE-family HTH domain
MRRIVRAKIEPTDTLAVVVTKLKKGSRLGYARIARVAGLSRQGVKAIADGLTRHPDAETLCRFAIGVLTDPDDGTIDQEELVITLEHLGRAGGYGNLREVCISTVLPVLLTVVTADHAASTAWLALVARQTPATDAEIRAFDAVLTATREDQRPPRQPG